MKKQFVGLGNLSSEITSTEISNLKEEMALEKKLGVYQKSSNFYIKVPWVSC